MAEWYCRGTIGCWVVISGYPVVVGLGSYRVADCRISGQRLHGYVEPVSEVS